MRGALTCFIMDNIIGSSWNFYEEGAFEFIFILERKTRKITRHSPGALRVPLSSSELLIGI